MLLGEDEFSKFLKIDDSSGQIVTKNGNEAFALISCTILAPQIEDPFISYRIPSKKGNNSENIYGLCR